MHEWYAPLVGEAHIRSVSPDELVDVPDDRFRTREAQLDYVPVTLTEIFIVGQSLPLTVLRTVRGPLLVAELRAGGQSAMAFDAGGAWRLPYRPMALRLLPFLASADGSLSRITSDRASTIQTESQMSFPLQRAVSGFARSVSAASELIDLAVAIDLVRLDRDDGQNALHAFRLLSPPLYLEPQNAACCRLVEAIRFSQQTKQSPNQNTRTTGAPTQARFARLRAEQLLSFDKTISFRTVSKSN